MSNTILVGYATRYNSTREVAEAIASTLRECGLAVDIQPLQEVHTLADYNAVLLGAPLYMFRWHKDALRFLSRHRKALIERPVAVFAVGPTHDPRDEKEWRDSWAQLIKSWRNFPGLNRLPSKCLAVDTTRRNCVFRSINLPVTNRQVICVTGQLSAIGQTAWQKSLRLPDHKLSFGTQFHGKPCGLRPTWNISMQCLRRTTCAMT